MKVSLFEQVPYRYLPEGFGDRYSSVVTAPYDVVDPPLMTESLFAAYAELLHAARAGFDGVCVTEHGQSAYDISPNPDLLASAVAYAARAEGLDVAITVLGRSLGKTREPLRIAEEYALLDCVSGGRLIAGFPVGLSYDANLNAALPGVETRERYREHRDLILKAWSEPRPFPWNGRFEKYGQVNIWPRPVKQPRGRARPGRLRGGIRPAHRGQPGRGEGRRMAWRPSKVGRPPPGHLWRWELEPSGAVRTQVACTYDWTQLTDPDRFARARATTAERLRASLDRLAALAEGLARLGSHQPFKLAFQPAGPGLDDGERQAEHRRDALRLRLQVRGPVLGEPDHPAVMAEVVRPQFRVPVQAEPGQHGPVEAAHQEVGQQVRAWLGVEKLAHALRAGEHVVAVQARQPPQPQAGAQVIKGAVGAAIGVGHRHPLPAGERLGRQPFCPGRDLLRAVVQDGGQGMHLDRPLAARDDLPDMRAQRPAGDHHQRSTGSHVYQRTGLLVCRYGEMRADHRDHRTRRLLPGGAPAGRRL
jgi:Luciferase-like monooxygenase